MRELAQLLLLTITACGNVQPLTSDDLYSLNREPKTWLTGTVVRQDTSAPLSDVVVTLGDLSTSSNIDGLFRFDELMPGTREGAATKTGFTRASFTAELVTGANQVELSLEPRACGGCAMGLLCDVPSGMCVSPATVTANVVSACDGTALGARVTISGHSTCSNETRGAWQLQNLTPGGPQTLSVGKAGYVVYSVPVTLMPGFNALGQVMLQPAGGCANIPADVPCSCTTPDCQ